MREHFEQRHAHKFNKRLRWNGHIDVKIGTQQNLTKYKIELSVYPYIFKINQIIIGNYLCTKQISGTDDFAGEFYKAFLKEIMASLKKSFKKWGWMEYFPAGYARPI